MVRIPVAIPDLSGNEEEYVSDAVKSTWISSAGQYIDRFEKEFASKCNTAYSLTVSNGTVALHLALLALDVGFGDEVLVPSLTYIATANAVRYVGAVPVFVDVDPNTWCIDPVLLEKKITGRTKGIIVVHLYGHPADMDAINAIAAAHGLWVVEDAAEAHFAKYRGKPVGGMGSIGTFSFYGNKIITCGEGGAITLNDVQLLSRAKTFRGQGMDPKRRYYFPVTGYNFRLTNVACAMLCAQLQRAKEIISRRKAIFRTYRKLLQHVPGIGFQPVAEWADPAPWLFCVIVDQKQYGSSRDELMKLLTTKGVDSRPFFVPLHTLPPFQQESQHRNDNLPVTDELSFSGINLPTYSTLSESDIKKVCSIISEGCN